MYEGNQLCRIHYWPDMIDWSNIRIVKTTFTSSNTLLTDDEKVKLRLKY